MAITLIIGIVAAIGLVGFGIIESGSLGNFWSLSSILITVGGTFMILVASYPLRTLKDVPKHMKIVFTGAKKNNPLPYIDTICEFALVARKNGLLALEELANNEADPFLKEGVLLVVDAVDSNKIREMMENKLDNMAARHEEAISLYNKGASLGPAFGMLGTLIGLINMLKSLDVSSSDAASTLGDGMSVALITTFYGSFLANVLFVPLANQLQLKNEEELLCKSIILEGVLSIQSGENPKFIREKLTSLLSAKSVEKYEKRRGGGSGDDGPESNPLADEAKRRA